MSLYSLIAGSVHADLDLSTSLHTGNVAYKNENAFYASGDFNSDVSLGRSIVFENSANRFHIVSHELVHQF